MSSPLSRAVEQVGFDGYEPLMIQGQPYPEHGVTGFTGLAFRDGVRFLVIGAALVTGQVAVDYIEHPQEIHVRV